MKKKNKAPAALANLAMGRVASLLRSLIELNWKATGEIKAVYPVISSRLNTAVKRGHWKAAKKHAEAIEALLKPELYSLLN